jgi:tRNA threonylcarbamoyl adenosine modification protein YeaZ
LNILALDTSSPRGIIALETKAGRIFSRYNEVPLQHNAFLLPGIKAVVEEARLNLQDLDLIACSVGPGSFVGTRLAVAVAQGLGYALHKPLVALNHLEIMAESARRLHGCNEVLVALDAKMGAFYFYHHPSPTGEKGQLLRMSDLPQAFHTLCDTVPTRIGDAWERSPTHSIQCDSIDLITLAKRGKPLSHPEMLLPLYFGDEGNWKKALH